MAGVQSNRDIVRLAIQEMGFDEFQARDLGVEVPFLFDILAELRKRNEIALMDEESFEIVRRSERVYRVVKLSLPDDAQAEFNFDVWKETCPEWVPAVVPHASVGRVHRLGR